MNYYIKPRKKLKFPVFNWQFYPLSIVWDRQLIGKQDWRNYSVECIITILKAGNERPPYDVSLYGARYYQDILFDYPVGIYLRYQNEDKHIKVLFSPKYKDVALYIPGGGIVAVGSCDLIRRKTPFHVKAEIYEDSIIVFIENKLILYYTKEGEFSERGKVGVGSLQDYVKFQNFKANTIKSLSIGIPTRRTYFSFRKWHNQEWLFDGIEPIARFYKEIPATDKVKEPAFGLVDVKLKRGYEPAGGINLFWILMEGTEDIRVPFYGREVPFCFVLTPDFNTVYIDYLKCKSSGESQILFVWQTHSKNNMAKSEGDLKVTFDSGLNRYYYDIKTIAELSQSRRWTRLEYADPYPNRNIKSPNPDEKWGEKYQWFIYEGEKGKIYKIPLNHNYLSWNAFPFYGRVCGWVLDENLNMMLIKKTPTVIGLCAWGFDLHLAHAGFPIRNKYKASYRVTSYDENKARLLLKKAKLAPIIDQKARFPVFILDKNTFAPKEWRNATEPHPEQRWSCDTSVWDRNNGHSDNYSLKIEGPGCITTTVGEGQFYGKFPYTRYELIAWVRTQKVTGGGAYLQYNGRKSKRRLSGTNKWTRVKMLIPPPVPQAVVNLVLDGEGIAWFDDVELKPYKKKR